MTSLNGISGTQQTFLAPPNTLLNRTATGGTTGVSSLGTNDKFANTNIVPLNYPEVTNTIPASIFPQQEQTNTGSLPPINTTTTTNTNTGTTTQTTNTGTTGTTTNTTLKPISMTEAQWAVKFEEKVQKQGYKPTDAEMAKYQDIVARFKANPKVDQSIVEILASQSTSLGAQVASMRYGKTVTASLRGLKPSTGSSLSGISQAEATASGGLISSLKGIGSSLAKGSGLGALVSGGFSLITNGIQVFQGKKTWSDAGGVVAADTVGGAISGITGTLGAGVAGLLVGGAGLLPTLVVGLGAMGGAWLGDKLFKGTGMYDKIKDKVTTMIEGGVKPQTYVPQQQQQQVQFNATQAYR
ncbi:MAG: hypothetical protein U0354_12665 [Candidatus Sericytochromatia bacterium]